MDYSTDDFTRKCKGNVEGEDKDIDMDMEYDMIPMNMYMPYMMPGMQPLPMYGNAGMQNYMQGNCPMIGAMPQGVQGMMMPPMYAMPDMMPENMNNVMGTEEIMPENMHGMKMMEDGEDEYSNADKDMHSSDYDAKEIDRILTRIERYNPGVFALLRRYGFPYPLAKRFIRRIVKLSLMYYQD